MPTNANTFNSRVTSEALENKFRQVFPAQGGAELVQDLFASGVIQPVVDFSSVAEGSVLPQNLQTAWDFATTRNQVSNTTTSLITNTGFWQVDLSVHTRASGAGDFVQLLLSDGITNKVIWRIEAGSSTFGFVTDNPIVVFLRAGDSLSCQASGANTTANVWYRQIATVDGTLVNPLGFSF
jgi:hypothetical protein